MIVKGAVAKVDNLLEQQLHFLYLKTENRPRRARNPWYN